MLNANCDDFTRFFYTKNVQCLQWIEDRERERPMGIFGQLHAYSGTKERRLNKHTSVQIEWEIPWTTGKLSLDIDQICVSDIKLTLPLETSAI